MLVVSVCLAIGNPDSLTIDIAFDNALDGTDSYSHAGSVGRAQSQPDDGTDAHAHYRT